MASNRGVAYMKPGEVKVQSIDFPNNGNNIQNGERDGIALVNTQDGTVYDALSYEHASAFGAITQAMPNQGPQFPIDLTEGGTPTEARDTGTTNIFLTRSPNGADTDDPASDWTEATVVSRG